MTTPDTSSIRPPRVLLYGDGNINLIDGSTIWLVSMAEVLARTGAHVTLFLKARALTRRNFLSLDRFDNVTVVDPFDQLPPSATPAPLTVDEVAAHVSALDSGHRFDVVLVRGLQIAKALTRTGRFDGRLWPYVIDVPGPEITPTPETLRDLADVALAADRMLVQTEDSRAYMEYRVPESVGRCFVILPMIPDSLSPLDVREPHVDALVGVYSGKFAMPWRTLELAALPEQLQRRGISLSLSMVGDKVMHSAAQPTWKKQMNQALRSAPGLLWTGGMAREDALAYCRTAQVGFSWRARELDSTHEISTKVLEYCAMGVAPVLNRIQAHVDLLGEDYPLFIDDDADSVADAVALVAHDPALLAAAQQRALESVTDYRMSAATERIGAALRDSELRQGVGAAEPPTPVLLVGRGLRDVPHLYEAVRRVTTQVRVHELGDADATDLAGGDATDLAGGDGGVVLYSATEPEPAVLEAVRGRGRLLVHLRGGSGAEEPAQLGALVDAAQPGAVVDAYVFDSETQLAAHGPVPGPSELLCGPVLVDVPYYDRPADPERLLRIGVLDYAPSRRRPDLALDLLERLHEAGCPATLHFRGDMPWHDERAWSTPRERAFYRDFFDRVDRSPLLSGQVAFEPTGADLPNWWGRVGWVVGFAEPTTVDPRLLRASAGGALVRLPASRLTDEVYGDHAAYQDLDALVREIVEVTSDDDAFDRATRAGREHAARCSAEQAAHQWRRILSGGSALVAAEPEALAVEDDRAPSASA